MKTPHTEVLRDFRLLEPLPACGLGELWKCDAPGGGFKTIRFFPGSSADLATLQQLRSIRHPALMPLDRVELVDGELMVVRDPVGATLATVLAEYRSIDRPGLPRAEALAYLRDVAEALDALAKKYGLQHLALRPEAIASIDHRARLVDFGLIQCLAQRPNGFEANRLGAAMPYVAPELRAGKIALASDQFGLAVTYHELLTGRLPNPGPGLDLAGLTPQDRAATARALDMEPGRRFATCGDFLQALLTAETRTGPRRGVTAPPRRGTGPLTIDRLLDTLPEVYLEDVEPRPQPAKATVSKPKNSSASKKRLGAAEARKSPSSDTVKKAKPISAGGGLPGYRLRACSARNALGEIWKAETASGNARLIRLLFDVDATENRPDGAPLERLRRLNHDALAPAVYLLEGANRLAVVSDPGKLSLAGRFKRCQADGLPGIPRHELLDHLRSIAEGIDAATAANGLQHLSLTARQIFIGGGRPRMIDFGLAELFWLPSERRGLAFNGRSTAPELLQGHLTRAADQYSLAVLFQEMLTGSHPFGHLGKQELLAAGRPKPDLAMLPTADHAAVLRALHMDPDRRFAKCGDFVAALEGTRRSSSRQVAMAPAPDHQPQPESSSRPLSAANRMTPAQVVGELVQAAAGAVELREFRGIRYVVRKAECIEHRCFARLLPGTAWLKLDGFRQRWQALATARDSDHFEFVLPADSSLWDRLMGRTPGLEVHVRLQRPQAASAVLTEIAMDVFPLDRHPGRAVKVLEEMGPLVLESLRHHLQAHKDRRCQERLPFDQFVRICPVFPNLSRGEPIEAHSRDISLHGMGLVLPHVPQTSQVAIQLSAAPGGAITVPGHIVRAVLTQDGQYDIGINFAIQRATSPPRPVAVGAGHSA